MKEITLEYKIKFIVKDNINLYFMVKYFMVKIQNNKYKFNI